jgi:small subunit ribosomal protein S13
MFGLRVRGQCTRTTGRKGGAVGVKKVVMRPSAAVGAAEAKEAAAPAPEAETATPEATTAKSSEPKSPETKE